MSKKFLFQEQVKEWMFRCFGAIISADKTERAHRFFEEAVELYQSAGCTQQDAIQLVNYTFSRPVGLVRYEVGGVMVTLAALCSANGIDMLERGQMELHRIFDKDFMERLRAKQASKPHGTSLPAAQVTSTDIEQRAEQYKEQYWVPFVEKVWKEVFFNKEQALGFIRENLYEPLAAALQFKASGPGLKYQGAYDLLQDIDLTLDFADFSDTTKCKDIGKMVTKFLKENPPSELPSTGEAGPEDALTDFISKEFVMWRSGCWSHPLTAEQFNTWLKATNEKYKIDSLTKSAQVREPESNIESYRVKEDMVCPVTKQHCDDETCPVGAICNLRAYKEFAGDGDEPEATTTAEAIVLALSNWHLKYPRDLLYNYINKENEMENELIAIEKMAMEYRERMMVSGEAAKADNPVLQRHQSYVDEIRKHPLTNEQSYSSKQPDDNDKTE